MNAVKNNYSPERRKELKILIEDFLDKDWMEIVDDIEKKKVTAAGMIEKIGGLLFPYRYYGDELGEEYVPDREGGEDPAHITDEDRNRLLLSVHRHLKPLWNELKIYILSLKGTAHAAKPSRRKAGLESIPDNFKIDVSEYKELNDGSDETDKMDNYYNIIIPKTKISRRDKFNFINIKAGWDGGTINLIREDIDLVNNFIGHMTGIPIDIFARCENCGKVIIVTRSDRKCCSTLCAASLMQKKKWAADPAASRERERERNRRRKEQKRNQ